MCLAYSDGIAKVIYDVLDADKVTIYFVDGKKNVRVASCAHTVTDRVPHVIAGIIFDSQSRCTGLYQMRIFFCC